MDSEPAIWPNLPGWFNPHRQPRWRPAFEVQQPEGCVRVCSDEPGVVAARRAAIGEAQNSEVEPAVVDKRIGWQQIFQDIFEKMRLNTLTSSTASAVEAAEETASEASEEEEMEVTEEAEAVE